MLASLLSGLLKMGYFELKPSPTNWLACGTSRHDIVYDYYSALSILLLFPLPYPKF